MSLFLLQVALGSAHAATYTIPSDFSNLREAMRLVADSDELVVDPDALNANGQAYDPADDNGVVIDLNLTIRGPSAARPAVLPSLSVHDVVLHIADAELNGVHSAWISRPDGALDLVDVRMAAYGATVNFDSVTVNGNRGVGLYLEDSSANLVNTHMSDFASHPALVVRSTLSAGADVTVYATDSTFENNEAGAIVASRQVGSATTLVSLHLYRVDFVGNSSDYGGDVAAYNVDELEFKICNFTDSYADEEGGSIYTWDTHLTLMEDEEAPGVANVFTDTQARYGGAIRAIGEGPRSGLYGAGVWFIRPLATGDPGLGGALYASDQHSELWGAYSEQAQADGGAMLFIDAGSFYGGGLWAVDYTVGSFGGAMSFYDLSDAHIGELNVCGGLSDSPGNALAMVVVDTDLWLHSSVFMFNGEPELPLIMGRSSTLQLDNNTLVDNISSALIHLEAADLVATNNLLAIAELGVSLNEGSSAAGDYNLWDAVQTDVDLPAESELPGAHQLAEHAGFWQGFEPSGALDCFVMPYLGFGSPAIDAGDPSTGYLDVDESRNDIGAFGGQYSYWYDDYDHDGDGFRTIDDCDEYDFNVNPRAAEVWYDGVDQDCDGNDGDQDLDGWPAPEDCDDQDPAVSPDAEEVSDGVDNDCDDRVDEGDIASPPDDTGDSDGSPPGYAVGGRAGCAAAPALPTLWWMAMMGALLRRRR